MSGTQEQKKPQNYFKVLVEKLASVFATPDSQIIVHEPKQGNIKGYIEERYGASVTNPNLHLLPEGYRDALTRLDTRFKVDMLLKYAAEKCPEIEACLKKMIDVRWYEEQIRRQEGMADALNSGSKTVKEAHFQDVTRKFNQSLGQTWQEVETFLDEINDMQERGRASFRDSSDGKIYKVPEEPVSRKALMEYIEAQRPNKKDSYDLYVQSLHAPGKKNNQFGVVLCDGISSQYMTQAEAMRVKREGKNQFLDAMPANGVLKQPDMASKCNMASSNFGPTPENAEQLGATVEKLIGESSWPEKVCDAAKTAAKAALTLMAGAAAFAGTILAPPEAAAVVGATLAGGTVMSAAAYATGFLKDTEQNGLEEESSSPTPRH